MYIKHPSGGDYFIQVWSSGDRSGLETNYASPKRVGYLQPATNLDEIIMVVHVNREKKPEQSSGAQSALQPWRHVTRDKLSYHCVIVPQE